MLDKCANPVCPAIFRNLHDGRLFVMELESEYHSSTSEHGRQPQYFWLCPSCCGTMTLAVEKGKGAQVVPLPESATAAQTAS